MRVTAVSISLRQCAPAHEQVNHLYAAVHKVHTQKDHVDGNRNDRAVSALVYLRLSVTGAAANFMGCPNRQSSP